MNAQGPIIDGLAGNRRVVRVHHAMDESHVHPARDQRGLAATYRAQQLEVGALRGLELRVVAIDHVVGQAPHRVRDRRAPRSIRTCLLARGSRRRASRRRRASGPSRTTSSPVRHGRERAGGREFRARAWIRSPGTRAAPARAPRGRRRRANRAFVPIPSIECRDAPRLGRSLRRGEWRVRRRVAARIVRTDGPHKPSRRDPPLRARSCPRRLRASAASSSERHSRPSSVASAPLNWISRGSATGTGSSRAKNLVGKRCVAIGEHPARHR